MAKRRALPAEDWRQIQKEKTSKDNIITPDLETGGKLNPAQGTNRPYPGQRAKIPEIVAVESSEVVPVKKPMPAPTGGETQDAFMARCMGDSVMTADFADNKQRYAVCEAQWGNRKKANDTQPPDQPQALPAAEPAGPELPGTQATAEEAAHISTMIALAVPEGVAKAISVPGGVPSESMHITLCYCGNVVKCAPGVIMQAVHQAVQEHALASKPLRGVIGGIGRFSASNTSDGKDVVYASVDVPELPDFHHRISKAAEAAGLTISKLHGFTPHITLAYIAPDAQMPVDKINRQEVEFTHVGVHYGTEKKLYSLGIAEVRKASTCLIIKANDDKRLLTGIVLQPEVVDAQGDIISADVITNAAHTFLSGYNDQTKLGLQHKQFPSGIHLVESWVVPEDATLYGRPLKMGTWMMTVYVADDIIWARVKEGKIRGFSIGGVAKIQRLS